MSTYGAHSLISYLLQLFLRTTPTKRVAAWYGHHLYHPFPAPATRYLCPAWYRIVEWPSADSVGQILKRDESFVLLPLLTIKLLFDTRGVYYDTPFRYDSHDYHVCGCTQLWTAGANSVSFLEAPPYRSGPLTDRLVVDTQLLKH